MSYVFDACRVASLPIVGSNVRFPVHRIYLSAATTPTTRRKWVRRPTARSPCSF